MSRKLALSSAALALVVVVVTSAHALAPVQADFNATARVRTNCTFTGSSFSAIAFGDYDPLGSNATAGTNDITASTVLSVKCTKGTTPTVSLNAGGNGFTDPNRFMKNAGNADTLAYKLTQPDSTLAADSTTTWKPTDTLTLPASTGRGNAINFTVFGHLASGQDASTGDYSDTVQATVNY